MLCISSLRLKGFGRFDDAHFVFKPGMNLIHGRNEAGKSTIMAAIAGVIFGFRKDRDRFISWSGTPRCEAEASFSRQGSELIIARDFNTDRVKALERVDGRAVWQFEGKVAPAGRSSEREEYLRKIEEVWGFAEADIFCNSIHIGQRDLRIEGEGALNAKLKQLLSGFSDIDYDGVRTGLEKELYDLTKKPGGRARDRELEEVRARMAELAELWREANRAGQEMAKQEEAVTGLRSGLESGRADLEKGRLYLERVRKYHALAEQEKQLQDEYSRLQADLAKVDALACRGTDLGRELDQFSRLAGLADDFPLRHRSYLDARERIARLEQERRSTENAQPAGVGAGPIVSLAMALACLLPAVLLRLVVPAYFYPALGVGAILCICLLVRAYRSAQVVKESISRQRGRIDTLTAEIVALRNGVADFEDEFTPFADDLSEGGGDRLVRDLESAHRLQAELAQVESALAVLDDAELLRGRCAELARELAVIRERMAGIVDKGFPVLSREELLEADDKMRRLELDLKEKERETLEREQELAVLRRGMHDLEAIGEEGEELKRREMRLVKRIAALRLAIELLGETLEEYRATYLDRFSQEINGKLHSLTVGRYREAVLDDGFNLSIGADGRLKPIEHYSCGVQDQTYLASRIALGEILSRGRNLPFLLDDPLVNFDDDRRGNALAALNLLAKGHQVLLFAHDDRLLRIKGSDGWNKIRLENMEANNGQLHLL